MKNRKFNLKSYLYNLVAVLFVAALFVQITPMVIASSAGFAMVSGTVLSFVEMPSLAFFMAVQVEIWEKDIEEAIFKDNAFLLKSKDVSANVLNGKVVHIPQSGGPGSIEKNRTTKPAVVRQRADTDVTYVIDEYTSTPLYIPNADTVELSYSKRDSAISEDKAALRQEVAEGMLDNWTKDLTAARVLRTIAANGTEVAATLDGATGNRYGMNLKDLQRARTFLAKEGRFFPSDMNALFPSSMLAETFPADSLITATAMQSVTEKERRNGIMYKQQGFDIMERSSCLIVGADGLIKPPGSVIEAGDSEAILLWWGQAVERAMGDIKFFEKLGDPQYYGDIYSFLARMGGRARRTENEGIVVLAHGVVS